MQSKPDDDPARHQNGALPPDGEQSERALSTPSSVPPMPQLVWDRLHARLASSGPTQHVQQQLLQELGRQLRNWRLRQRYTRQELANKLQLEVGLLLVLERGLAEPADVTIAQLTSLASLLSKQGGSKPLYQAIDTYLTSLTK